MNRMPGVYLSLNPGKYIQFMTVMNAAIPIAAIMKLFVFISSTMRIYIAISNNIMLWLRKSAIGLSATIIVSILWALFFHREGGLFGRSPATFVTRYMGTDVPYKVWYDVSLECNRLMLRSSMLLSRSPAAFIRMQQARASQHLLFGRSPAAFIQKPQAHKQSSPPVY